MQQEAIKTYFELFSQSDFHTIDDATANDLDVDSLFDCLNRTDSSLGEQFLYRELRCISCESIAKQYDGFVRSLLDSPALREKISKIMKRLHHPDAYSIIKILTEEQVFIGGNRWFRFLSLFRFVPAVLLGVFLFSHHLFALWCLLGSIAVNLLVHFQYKMKIFYHAGGICQLHKMLVALKQLEHLSEIKELRPNLSELNNALSRLRSSASNFRLNFKFESESMLLAWFFVEIFRVFTLIEPIGFHKTFLEIKLRKDEAYSAYCLIGMVDFLQAVARIRMENERVCTPGLESGGKFEAIETYHPLIPHCIENSLSLTDRSFLILGSNMSGKTTFMRTIGVNVLLAQTLNLCFASEFTLSPMKIFTSIAMADNLLEGKSYYLAEVLRTKSIIEESQESNNLVLLDELFKGTNTPERIASAKAVLSYLGRNGGNRILVATHDFELVKLLENKYAPLYFVESVSDNNLSFDYKLKLETSGYRNAIRILEIYGYPKEIIKDAHSCIENN